MTDLPQDTRVALGEIKAGQQYVVKTMDEFRKEMREERDDINRRLFKLEQFQWKLIGMAVASGLVLPVLTSLLVWWLTK